MRVVFIHEFTFTSQVETAAALRRAGLDVQLVTQAPTTIQGRVRRLIDGVVFHKIHPWLDPDNPADERTLALLGPPTVDVHCFDILGEEIAAQRPDSLRAGLIDPAWYNKWYLAQRLEELGIPGPDVSATPHVSEYPVLVKAKVTSGGLGVRRCNNQMELNSAWQYLGGPDGAAFIQEFISGPTYSTTALCINGELVHACTYELIKDPQRPFSPSVGQRIIADDIGLTDNVRKLMAQTDFTGIFSCQQVLDEQGRGRIFDLNPRVPGSWAGIEAIGYNFLEMLIAYLRGEPLPAPVSAPPGTEAESVHLGSIPEWQSWQDARQWNKRTKRIVAKRRKQFGWRMGVWATSARYQLAAKATRYYLRKGRSQ